MVLIVCQLSKLLHGTVSFISFEDYGVQYLSHHEKMVDFVLDNLFEATLRVHIKLILFRLFESFGTFLALGARLEELKLAVHLIFQLLQFGEEELFIFSTNLWFFFTLHA